MLAIVTPFPQFFDIADGSPLDGGYVYFGIVNNNAETNPITVCWDAAGTQPVAQPARTLNGYIARNGTPAQVYADQDYSMTVRDHRGRLQFVEPNSANYSSSQTILTLVTNYIASVASSIGSSLSGFIQALAGSQPRTVQDKLRENVSVFDFMTPTQIADVIAGTLLVDVTAAIQAAINATCGQTSTTVGQAGGKLFFPAGKYLVSSTLYFGYGLVAEGVWAGGYPYVSSTTKTSELHFKFGASTTQWGIDTQTFHSAAGGGGRILYNEWVDDHIGGTGATGYTATYGLSIKGLLLIDDNNALQTQIPFGALRLVGAPNSRIENVSILGFGYAMAFQGSYGTAVRNVTGSSNYYGAVAYNANNDISFHGCQFDQIISPARLTTVPVGAIPSWMTSGANFVAVYNLDASHNASPKGLIIAAAPAIGTNGAVIDVIAQYWTDTCFLNNAYSNTFLSLYAEQCAGFVLTTAYASFNMVDGHNFSSTAPLPYFADIGYNSIGKINVGGNNTFLAFWKNAWASVSGADATRVSVVNVSGTGGTLPANQRVTMEYEAGSWTPVVSASAGAITTVTGQVGTYTKTRDSVRLEYSFTITTNGTGAGVLQVDGMPYVARTMTTQFASVGSALGATVTSVGSTQLHLFSSTGTYPGANATNYSGVITYLV